MPGKRRRRGWGFVQKPRTAGGRFEASYMHVHEGTPTRFRAPKTFGTRMAAEAWLHSERVLIDQGGWTPPKQREKAAQRSSLTLAEFAEVALASRTLEPTTRSEYKRLLDSRITPRLGSHAIVAITADELDEWWQDLGSTYEASRAAAWNLLKSLLRDAVEREVIPMSPAENPRFKRYGRRPPRRPITLLTVSEIETGTAKLPDYYALGLPIMAWCALRFAELSELRVKDIEDGPKGMVIHVRRSAPLVDGKPVVKDGTKTDAGIRDVWVPSPLAERIRDRLRAIDSSPNTFVVSNFRGNRLPRATFTKQFKKALPPAKAEMHVHALRHTGAVFAAWAGATTAELQERLGHATMEMAALYQHVAEGRQRAIAQKMSDLS